MPSALRFIPRRLVVVLFAALFLLPFASAHNAPYPHTALVQHRGLFGFPDSPDTPTTSQDTSTQAKDTSTSSQPTSSSTASTSQATSQSQQQTSSATASDTSSKQQSTSSTPATSSSSQPTSSATSSSSSAAATSTPPPTSSASQTTKLQTSVSTDAEGQPSTIIYTVTAPVSFSSSAAPSNTGAPAASGGVSTGTIVGLSVAGGVAVIGLVVFIIWKLGRKRFSDEYNDEGDIKWPELNAHGESPLALPTQRLKGAGFETSSEVNLVRPESRAGSFATSNGEMYSNSADPYAVPPLPHLNPNAGVPYRDDPGAGYYDPYNGPVPQTLDGEAIPMTQIPARARSPMPPGSPAPTFDGRRSPGPQAAYGAGLGVPQQPMRVASPGPGYGGGRMSPGPQAAYGAAPGYAP